MRALIGLLEHELRFHLLRPWASLWLAAWTLLAMALPLVHGQLLDGKEALLTPVFLYLPWIGAFLIPALGMKLWAREADLGTLVWLFSLPHSTLRVLLVKFGAAWILLILGLLCTLPLPLTLLYLGQPDRGIMATSYLGIFGFLSVQLGLCNLASCLSRRPLAAYVLGFCLCMLSNLPACDLLNDSLPHGFSSGWMVYFTRWSSSYHLLGFLRGVVDSADLIYWFGMIMALLCASYIILIRQRSLSSSSWRHPEPRTLVGLCSISLLGIILLIFSTQNHKRWDMTEEKLFTLSDGSRSIVEKLRDPLHVTFYFSRSHAELEPSLRIYGQRIQELLREYAASVPGRFSYEVVDPQPQSPQELDARINGLLGLNTSQGDTLYFGAVFTMSSLNLSVPYFDPQKEDQLEYELSEAIVRISQKVKPVLGILSSLPVIGDQGRNGLELTQDWAFVAALRSLYHVVPVATQTEQIPSHIHTLLVIHPKGLSPKTEFAIDQFVLRGGNLLIAVDPLSRSELAYTPATTQPPAISSDLPLLFNAWGITYDPQQIVGDKARSISIQNVVDRFDYPFYIKLLPEDLNTNHPVAGRVQELVYAEPGSLARYQKGDLHWQILAQTSEQSGTVSTDQATYLAPAQLATQLKSDGKKRVLAAVLFGRFRSAFAEIPEGSAISDHITEATRENSLIVFSDVDFLADHHVVEKIQSLNQMVLKPKNDNLSFFLKAIEFVGGNKDLVAIRNSRRSPRPYLRLQKLAQAGQEKWQSDLDQVSSKLQELQARLKDEQNAGSGQRILSPQQEQEIRELRIREAQFRADQRRLRLAMQEDSLKLRRSLIWTNLLLIPLVLLGIWLVYLGRQRYRAPIASSRTSPA